MEREFFVPTRKFFVTTRTQIVVELLNIYQIGHRKKLLKCYF